MSCDNCSSLVYELWQWNSHIEINSPPQIAIAQQTFDLICETVLYNLRRVNLPTKVVPKIGDKALPAASLYFFKCRANASLSGNRIAVSSKDALRPGAAVGTSTKEFPDQRLPRWKTLGVA